MEFQCKPFSKHNFYIHFNSYVCIKYVIFNCIIICFDNTNLLKYVTHFDLSGGSLKTLGRTILDEDLSSKIAEKATLWLQ